MLFATAPSASAQTRTTVLQLQEFLTSTHDAKISDADLADWLRSVILLERTINPKDPLEPPGPPKCRAKTAEQLELLASVHLLNDHKFRSTSRIHPEVIMK